MVLPGCGPALCARLFFASADDPMFPRSACHVWRSCGECCCFFGPAVAHQDLQAAKHRFQSFARPLGRMVRLIRQIIRLMERLARPGQNRDRKCKAAVFLRNVSAKDLLCCACLADISHECMAIVRFTDHEQFDSSQLSHELTLFLRRAVCAAKAAQHYHLRR